MFANICLMITLQEDRKNGKDKNLEFALVYLLLLMKILHYSNLFTFIHFHEKNYLSLDIPMIKKTQFVIYAKF